MTTSSLTRALSGRAFSRPVDGSVRERRVTAARHAGTNALIQEHLWLVDRILSRTAASFPAHVERSDLWSAGVLGLVEAAQRFDPDKGVPFDRYASARVRGEILEATRSRDLAPRRLRRRIRELAQTTQRLNAELGRDVTVEELAAELDLTVDELLDLREAADNLSDTTSLDLPVGESGVSRGELLDGGADTDPAALLEDRELHGTVRDAVQALPSPLLEIVVRSYWNGERLADIADDMGVTPQRVAQYRAEAITAMTAWFSRLYDGLTPPADTAPGRARRVAFAAEMASRSTWRARLDG